MVLITSYNYSYWGESKPTYNWGAPLCSWMVYEGTSHLQMDDDWGYAHLWKLSSWENHRTIV